MKLSTCTVAAVAALGLSDAGAGFVSRDFVIDDFSVLQSVSVAAGEVGGNTAGNGTTSCWYMATCYRDIVIDNSAAHHTTTASVVYNDQTPTLGPNYEFSAHVSAGDKVRFILTWDGDTTSGNFGTFSPDDPQGFPSRIGGRRSSPTSTRASVNRATRGSRSRCWTSTASCSRPDMRTSISVTGVLTVMSHPHWSSTRA